jgi:hypothetical protein
MNYQIIVDEQAVRDYIDWLPDLEEHEKYYACLFMRKKYCKDVPWIKSDKGQLKRFVSDKDRLFDKISQLEVKVGAYKFDGNDVPQESLALYISPNPRNLWRATIRSIGQLAKVLEGNSKNCNPHAEVLSEIQRSASERDFVIFDIDEKNETTLNTVIETVDGYCDVVETRGGYHVFVHKDKVESITDKMWYTKIQKFSDQCGDLMSPVVGTYQGGHVPNFIRKYNRDN